MSPAEIDAVLAEVRALAESPPYTFESGYERLAETPQYRQLVGAGPGALDACFARLRDGDLFLLPAILEISRVRADELIGKQFPSDQEVARALIDLWEMSMAVQFVWAATSAGGSTSVASARSHVSTVPQPIGVSLVQQVAPELVMAELARQEGRRKHAGGPPSDHSR
jgi:hypothetical protein